MDWCKLGTESMGLVLEPLQSELKLEDRDFLPRMAEASKALVESDG